MLQVYILHSDKLNRFYTGFTSNLEEKLSFHKNAENRKFTHNALDWILFFTIYCESEQSGLQMGKYIKSMKSKTYIENLTNILKWLKN